MKSIYILHNYDTDENMYASEDKELLQEILYDMYLRDAYEIAKEWIAETLFVEEIED